MIDGHWVWSPAVQELALNEKIEAYNLPGVSSQFLREIGAGRPGLFIHVALGTVCDPRRGGGRMNQAALNQIPHCPCGFLQHGQHPRRCIFTAFMPHRHSDVQCPHQVAPAVNQGHGNAAVSEFQLLF